MFAVNKHGHVYKRLMVPRYYLGNDRPIYCRLDATIFFVRDEHTSTSVAIELMRVELDFTHSCQSDAKDLGEKLSYVTSRYTGTIRKIHNRESRGLLSCRLDAPQDPWLYAI